MGPIRYLCWSAHLRAVATEYDGARIIKTQQIAETATRASRNYQVAMAVLPSSPGRAMLRLQGLE